MKTDWNARNLRVIEEFRANAGKVGGNFARMPVVLLTTRGARSGRLHTTPLAFSRDGDRILVVASKGGAPTNPDWYHNLVANPTVTVEVGAETFEARVVVLKGGARPRLRNPGRPDAVLRRLREAHAAPHPRHRPRTHRRVTEVVSGPRPPGASAPCRQEQRP